MSDILTILLLSLVAGLGTGIGGLIAIIRKPGRRSFGFLMGVTAGVMITLSFMELVTEAWELAGYVTATVGFSCGAIFMFLIDYFVPHIRFGEREATSSEENPHPASPNHLHYRAHPTKAFSDRPFFRRNRNISGRHFQRGRTRFRRTRMSARHYEPSLLRTGLLIAVGITIHNLPEGIAVGAGYMHLPKFGLFIALAIMLHNIPEGIAVALPLCKSGMCRWDAFRIALFSGLVEPIGALAAALFLGSFELLIPGALAFAGGVMVFITLDELIPTAREHGHQHFTALGIIMGSVFVFLLSGVFGV